jgi:thiol-disulfide isomerase/thioredoxin
MKKKIIIVLLFILHFVSAFGINKKTEITGNLSFLNNGDTVEVSIQQNAALPYYKPIVKQYTIIAQNHRFRFQFICTQPYQYINVAFKNKGKPGLINYIIQTGSRINMEDLKGFYVFSGWLSQGFALQQKIKQVITNVYKTMPDKLTAETLIPYFNNYDLNIREALNVLDSGKGNIGKLLYNQIKTDIIYGSYWSKYHDLRWYGHQKIDSVHLSFVKSYNAYVAQLSFRADTILTGSFSKIHSAFYTNYLFEKYFTDSCFLVNKPFSEHKFYLFAKANFSGTLRDQLVTSVFLTRKQITHEDLLNDINDELTHAVSADFRQILNDLKSNNINAPAFDFSLKDVADKTVKLSDFTGKVVVLDFYFTGCRACKVLAPIMEKLEYEFKGKQVIFIAISIDRNKSTWLSSVNQNLYSSPLSLNLFTSGNGTDDPVIKHYNINSYPTLILINKDGRIGSNPQSPLMDEGRDLKKLINFYTAQ